MVRYVNRGRDGKELSRFEKSLDEDEESLHIILVIFPGVKIFR